MKNNLIILLTLGFIITDKFAIYANKTSPDENPNRAASRLGEPQRAFVLSTPNSSTQEQPPTTLRRENAVLAEGDIPKFTMRFLVVVAQHARQQHETSNEDPSCARVRPLDANHNPH